MKKLEIRTAPVSINTICLDNKQMTLAVFRQILIENPFDIDHRFIGKEWIGTVHYKGCWLIWLGHDSIRKYNLNNIKQITREKSKNSFSGGLGISLKNIGNYSSNKSTESSKNKGDCISSIKEMRQKQIFIAI